MMEWLSKSWEIVVFIAGAIGVIAGLVKNARSIKNYIKEPFENLNSKIDAVDSRLSNQINEDKLIKQTLLSMQRQQLLDICEKCQCKDSITMEEKQTIYSQFESYKGLGGNSFVEDMVDRVMELPTKHEKKK